jgi:hypothetical protein
MTPGRSSLAEVWDSVPQGCSPRGSDAPLQGRAVPWGVSYAHNRTLVSSVMAAAAPCPGHSGNAGESRHVASGPSSVTCTRRFWPPIWVQQICFPRVPGTGGIGRVGSPESSAHAYEHINQQRASAGQHLSRCVTYPWSEMCVFPKVLAEPHKSRSPAGRGKAGNVEAARGTRLRLSPERSQMLGLTSSYAGKSVMSQLPKYSNACA